LYVIFLVPSVNKFDRCAFFICIKFTLTIKLCCIQLVSIHFYNERMNRVWLVLLNGTMHTEYKFLCMNMENIRELRKHLLPRRKQNYGDRKSTRLNSSHVSISYA